MRRVSETTLDDAGLARNPPPRGWFSVSPVAILGLFQANLTDTEVAMARRLVPRFFKFLCCTGYETVTMTVQTTALPGTPVTISAPPGKYMLDHEPYPTWPPPGSGSMAPWVAFNGAPIAATLPDGRVLPTGWSGTIGSSYLNPSSPPVPTKLTIRCISA